MIFDKYLDTDLVIIKPNIFGDDRGFFYESYNSDIFKKNLNLNLNFLQDNHSFSSNKTLRGLHYQKKPFEQGKLVRVTKGLVLDVVLDLRKNSKNFLKHYSFMLSDNNRHILWIPEGYAHGFIVLSETAEFLYKTTNFYSQKDEININPFDNNLNIDWFYGQHEVLQSSKDKNGLSLKEALSLIY